MIKSKIVINSGIYSVLNLFQKGINFLLIPVLTTYLTTYDYGVVAVVTAINAFLNVFYLLSLNGSLNRFYYEYKHDEELVKKLFGTIVSFVFLFSLFLSAVLGLGHRYFIDPFLKDVSFFPYMFLGMVSILFNPVFTIFQNTLQAKQEGKRYGKNNLFYFITNLSLLLISVIVFELGARGVLGALAITNVIFFIYTLTNFGKEISLGIDKRILRESLSYSLPLVPHSISGVATNIIDRLFINSFLSTAMAGVYNLGNTFGGIIFLLASGVNQAFVPWFNEQIKSDKYDQIPVVAKSLVIFYSTIALGLSFFGKEIIFLITPPSYHEAWKVIPFISFAFVFHSIYYFFSTPLFYNIENRGSRVLPFFTVSAAGINIILNYFFIQEYGIIGAALATLIAKFILALGLKMVYKRFVHIKYANMFLLFIPCLYFICSMLVFYDLKGSEIIIKVTLFAILLILSLYFSRHEIRMIVKNKI